MSRQKMAKQTGHKHNMQEELVTDLRDHKSQMSEILVMMHSVMQERKSDF